jgi:hypothetical protein
MLTLTVTEDLVRYMDYAISYGGPFLTNDPNWAMDFAPNGSFRTHLTAI